MGWVRPGAAIAFVVACFALQAAPTALGLVLPIVTGLAIGRWWALGLSMMPIPLYVAFQPDIGDLPAWFSVGGGVLLMACLLAAGIALRLLIARVAAV